MSTFTPNLNLEKPDPTDLVDVGVLNSNSDLIDAAYGRTPDGSLIGDILFAYSTVDQVFTEFAFVTATELQIPINYAGIYTVEALLYYKTNDVAREFGATFSSSLSGGTVKFYGMGPSISSADGDISTTNQVGSKESGNGVVVGGMVTNNPVSFLKGLYNNTGTTPTGGNFRVRCFPSTAGGSATLVANSWVKLQRVA